MTNFLPFPFLTPWGITVPEIPPLGNFDLLKSDNHMEIPYFEDIIL